ncbi:outer membrane beta-barrel protein [Arenibacter sp. F20364]|uniref:outer membrane beta-barrel protein n=1 Tax=Arenibacter sp. F20364 TaxID=2926415 RepID=UPI001FF1C203|nr:outer membrane beta-barrel protein [Arenibacter sp. F20364]MCK0192621.1 outer membrane beta-barrel protein [Arenibacter sp. F20364]
MSENNLDKLFQEKLSNFKEVPDEKVWNSIAASLDNKKRSRKLIPLWWKVGGAAAILAILFFAINPFSSSEPVAPIITDVEKKTRSSKDSNSLDELSPEATSITGNEGKTSEENNIETTRQTDQDKITDPRRVTESTIATGKAKNNNSGKDQKNTITPHPVSNELVRNNSDSRNFDKKTSQDPADSTQPGQLDDSLANKNMPTAVEQGLVHQENNNIDKPEGKTQEAIPESLPSNKKSILEAIEENEVVEVKEPHNGKWSAGPSVAPVYFNGLGEGSPINSILASNTKTGSVTLSYGITVAYEISKKLSVRSGIHKVDYGYDTNDVSFTSSFNASTGNQISNINYSNDSQSIILNNPNSENVIPKPGSVFASDVTGKNPTRLGTMGQQMGYLEVPLELNYALVDRKLGVNIIGGVSSLFLTDNSVVLESSGQTTEVGEANNVNSVNFSTNFGLGLDYKFTPKLKFIVEPVFKYQLNTFSNTSGNFNPYSLGVYSGFTLKF